MFKTNEEYLLLAYQKATESPDPSTQNGAVIPYQPKCEPESDCCLVSACNTFPAGVHNKPDRLERPKKYSYIEHAERGVI
jgi:hypothetical protein